ncbi:MAG: acetyl-CoA carboxylase biotin carboxyl carrier protein subunit [Defluviitaleaceae bacterium]|nr:acetyl-CoA carboxylase biotin carboxyl carrier protein subunit [Defluviitaleaceae bacterium]
MKEFKISVNGKSYDVQVEEIKGAAPVAAAPVSAPAPVAPKAAAPAPSAAPKAAAPVTVSTGDQAVKAPMNGTIIKHKVAVGAAVKKNDVIVILEAMKMENDIVSPVDGVLKAFPASEGATVAPGDVIAVIG